MEENVKEIVYELVQNVSRKVLEIFMEEMRKRNKMKSDIMSTSTSFNCGPNDIDNLFGKDIILIDIVNIMIMNSYSAIAIIKDMNDDNRLYSYLRDVKSFINNFLTAKCGHIREIDLNIKKETLYGDSESLITEAMSAITAQLSEEAEAYQDLKDSMQNVLERL